MAWILAHRAASVKGLDQAGIIMREPIPNLSYFLLTGLPDGYDDDGGWWYQNFG
jgi:hypothetical protein